ncbi:hypothetical protein [Brevibacillus sp. SAFN-007a]|uniref:hypothetical protein n=1 Tax=Brevibacillus sp. SAFN-007a TaxID=3436862 RepID=UPI003F7D1D06
MGKLFSYILLTMTIGILFLLMIPPQIALFIGMCIIAGTLFYIIDLLKREQPRMIRKQLERSFQKRERKQEKGETE